MREERVAILCNCKTFFGCKNGKEESLTCIECAKKYDMFFPSFCPLVLGEKKKVAMNEGECPNCELT